MVVNLKNRKTGQLIIVDNVRDIQYYTHIIKGKMMVLSDLNYGSNNIVDLNIYELVSVF